MSLVLKNYEIVKECRGNKHNRIYLLEHKENKSRYILKIISLYEEESQLREINIHKNLSHKYVINLIKHELKGDKIYMLVEYAKYGDLFSFLPKMKEFSERKILKIFYKILKSLEYLHGLGYIHRDIKPENILITNNLRPKLADFGTSVDIEKVANTFCGTYEYMAPEIYLRCKQSNKVDVWAVGILLYEMIHRATPFKNDNLQTIKNKIEGRKICFKGSINPMMIDFIYSSLKFDPKIRPSITELLKHPLFNSIKNKRVVVAEEPEKRMPTQKREMSRARSIKSGKVIQIPKTRSKKKHAKPESVSKELKKTYKNYKSEVFELKIPKISKETNTEFMKKKKIKTSDYFSNISIKPANELGSSYLYGSLMNKTYQVNKVDNFKSKKLRNKSLKILVSKRNSNKKLNFNYTPVKNRSVKNFFPSKKNTEQKLINIFNNRKEKSQQSKKQNNFPFVKTIRNLKINRGGEKKGASSYGFGLYSSGFGEGVKSNIETN